jgi:hypothetical protein
MYATHESSYFPASVTLHVSNASGSVQGVRDAHGRAVILGVVLASVATEKKSPEVRH